MYVSVQPGRVDVVERTDYRRFHLQADANVSLPEIGALLQRERLGGVDDGHAWIRIDSLRERLAGFTDFDAEQFSEMVTYATQRGWVSPDGAALRTHIQFGDQR
ncbi:hypothetical protein MHN80_01115 [Gordonia McavH-238-E]|uniref:hypothetical protein n=1 Tax=Gordonia sp. McavH-238-E TaxID=2917736 RepID=UPI001EF5234B|nr:hypothetical protein [Gordonia sp. McavH-238-E]MCG7630904.1 hypothetical protein [Gordonia sp. McavH-238-E]